jgi:nucleotide-binding universal stress UspA family protein
MAWAAPAREAAAYYERQYQEARAMVGSLAATLEKDHVSATAEARTGAAATEIIKAAVDYGADLIVMATHGRTGLSHLVLGSVAEHVIRHARCPVLAMRDNQPESGSVSAAEVAENLA